MKSPERLVSAALIRNGVVENRGFREHWKIRAALGDASPSERNRADEEGFLTSAGRFFDRHGARAIGIASGQLAPMWATVQRSLLSSDIDW